MDEKTSLVKRDEEATAIMPSASNLRMLAKDLLESHFFPQAKNVGGVVTIIEYGRELGLPPVASLQIMSVVNGKLCMEAKAMLALFQQRGGKITIIKKDKTGSKVRFEKAGQTPYEESFTIEDAKALGFLTKQNWRSYPEEMCYARCIAKGTRAYDPGSILGLYAKEEVQDFGPEVVSVAEAEVIENKPVEASVPATLPKTLGRPKKTPPAAQETPSEPVPAPAETPATPEREPGEDDQPAGATPEELAGEDPFADATFSTPDPAKEKVVNKIKAGLEALGVDAKVFKEWLFVYQEKIRRFCVGKKFQNFSLHEGKLEDLQWLSPKLEKAVAQMKSDLGKKT